MNRVKHKKALEKSRTKRQKSHSEFIIENLLDSYEWLYL